VEPRFVDRALVLDQMGRHARGPCDLDEPVRVRAVHGADHEQEVDLREHRLDRVLAVRRRVADVLFPGAGEAGKPPAQDRDDLCGVVDRERGLRQVGEPLRLGRPDVLGLRRRLHEQDRGRGLAERPLDLVVPGMADQEDRVAERGEEPRLRVHLRHERAGRVHGLQASGGGIRVRFGRHAVGGEDDWLAYRHVALAVHEDRASRLEVADDVRVVDDLTADVDRRAVLLERRLDRVDRPFHAGAVAARGGQEDTSDHCFRLR